MNKQQYLIIGTTTADLLDDKRVLGGSVSYAARVIKHFGYDVRILTSGAPDDSLLRPLFDLAETRVIPAEHTTTFSNIYTSTGRQQIIHKQARDLTSDMLPQTWHNPQLVHLAPLTDDVDYVFASQFPDATVLLTPQGYMRQWGEDGVVTFKRFLDRGVLEAIDILVLSKQDILDDPSLEREYPKYTDHVVVTDGENGGMYYHNGDTYHYDAYPVTEIDPTGAGDVFAAALLASLPQVDFNMKAALAVAARLSAEAVTVKGAALPLTSSFMQQVIQEAKEKYD